MTVHTATWWAASRGEVADQWVSNYQGSVDGRQRRLLSTIVGELGAETVIEVGCHCGPNLVRLARDYPSISCIGVDVNEEAVRAGRAWVERLGLGDRIRFDVGEAQSWLAGQATDTADVVVTTYCLAYFSPGDLPAVLYEIGRVAELGAILLEPLPSPAYHGRESPGGYQEWTHDYDKAGRWISTLRDRFVSLRPIDPPVDHLNGAVVFSP